MSWESGKVGLACALGAIIGLFIALEIGWFWPIGLIIGCATAYFTYEWQVVVGAFSCAYHTTRGWRPKNSPRAMVTLFGWFLATLALMAIWLIMLSYAVGKPPTLSWPLSIWSYIFLCSGFFLLLSVALQKQIEQSTLVYKEMCFALFPPLTAYYLLRGLIWFGPRFVRWLARFLPTFFFLIHSEGRLLCLFGAAIGFFYGYLAGSILAGGVVGGLFGLIYHAIVVERLLKPRGLIPAKPQ